MKKPVEYNITPAKGQALLNFQGRRLPDKIEAFETRLIEEVRPKRQQKLDIDKQSDINMDFQNLLIHGDCLSACAYLKSQNIRVDLVYIDPPFASGANYAKKVYLRNGGKAAIENGDSAIGEEIMYGDIWQKEDYLNWLYERLLAIREIMSETASIYVHLDWHIGHYVKILLDEVFGELSFMNEIIWKRASAHSDSKTYANVHDTILFYTRSEDSFFNQEYSEYTAEYIQERYKHIDKDGRRFADDNLIGTGLKGGGYTYAWKGVTKNWRCPIETMRKYENENKLYYTKNGVARLKRYIDELPGKPVADIWTDIFAVNSQAGERVEYTTQKPESLLQRMISASSNTNMIVADFFSGSSTTAKVAHDLGRKFIACDIGINAIQTSRDRLMKAGTAFNILKIYDGLRLFRNPAQTTAKIFSLIDGFKTRTELELGEFWDGGIIGKKGAYIPVKFIGIDKKLTPKLVDAILEEVYQLEDSREDTEAVRFIYAHRDLEVTQQYINKEIHNAGKTEAKVELIGLDDLLQQKAEVLFSPDNADIGIAKEGRRYKVEIKRFFSSYLKNKIDDYNAKKVKKGRQVTMDDQAPDKNLISINENGLELIESVQFDTTFKKDSDGNDIWTSNPDLEDKAGIKEKIKGVYFLPTDTFRMKIRNIAGDEIIIESSELPVAK